MTDAFADMADDRFFRPQFIDMQGDGQTKQPRTAALTLGDSHVFKSKKRKCDDFNTTVRQTSA